MVFVKEKKKKRREGAGTGVKDPRKALGQDIVTEPKRFSVGGIQVTEEEFRRASRELRSQAEGERIIQAGGIGPEEIAARKEGREVILQQPEVERQARETLEEAGAFEEVTPREVSLAPKEALGGGIPLLGPSVTAIGSALGDVFKDTPFAGEEIIRGKEAFPIPLTEETIREAALREIKQKSFDEGISVSESIGSLIESIPVVGSLANKYAAGLTQTPSANAQTVLDEINKIKEAASTGQEKVRNGLEDPDFGLDRARSMEEDVAKLEGRIKLLINTSAHLRANADNVNKIQEQILEAREKISRYKTASSFGLTAQLTGTGRIIPTDEQMFFELKRLKEK